MGLECDNMELILCLWEQVLWGDEFLLSDQFYLARILSPANAIVSDNVPRENAREDASRPQKLYNFHNAKAIIIYTLMTLPIKRQVLDIGWFILPRAL